MMTWIKYKYARPKTTGRYRSHHDDGTRRRHRRAASDREKARILRSQPLVTLVIRPNGKRVFVRQARDTS